MKKILAFETSCDDTAAAIVSEDGSVLGEAIFSQLEAHRPYGGVVPEIGSRAHIEQITLVTKEALKKSKLGFGDIDAVAATFAPGLLGPLLVGAQFAKGVALALSKPLIAVHHLEGHIFSGYGEKDFLPPPFLALVVSGGHTALYECREDYSLSLLGETLDDAAGEAFDKIGRALGLGYPSGKIIDDLAQTGKIRFSFPPVMRKSDCLNFSFSGLKTHALDLIKSLLPLDENTLADFCASFQEAIASALVERSIKAVKKTGCLSLVIGGGVTANSRLRDMLTAICASNNIKLFLPEPRYCTDNASMIAKAAHLKLKEGRASTLSMDVCARLPIEEASFLLDRML